MAEPSADLPFLTITAGCTACEWCRFSCPVDGCFTFDDLTAAFHPAGCIECARCVYACPNGVIHVLRPGRKPARPLPYGHDPAHAGI